VLEACRADGVLRFIHVSSLSVLHWAGLAPGAAVTEDAPVEADPQARGHYTRAKLAAERLVLDAVRAHGLDAVVVRPGLIVGPGHWTPGTVDGVRLGRTLVALGGGGVPLPLVHVDDVVEALVCASRAATPPGAIYHVVGDGCVTRAALARAIAAVDGGRAVCVPDGGMRVLALGCELLGRALGRSSPLTRYRVRSTAARVTFDCSRAARDLGWSPSDAPLMPASGGAQRDASAATECVPARDTPTASHDRAGAPAAAAR
jgi:nucleoside-diphosphate-sugar epimerase